MKPINILLIFTIFVAATLACNLPTQPKTPKAPIDPVQALNEAVEVDPVSQSITITLTEDQMNAILSDQLAQITTGSDFTISNPAVKLRDGLITITGKIENGLLGVDFKVVLKPSVTNDHKINCEVVETDFGPIPIPEEMTQQMAEQINTAINAKIGEAGDQVSVDTINIADGKMTITAHR